MQHTSQYELAQLNIGIVKGPMDSPIMAEFADNLDRINAIADGSPGFVWRLQTEEGNATAIRPFENDMLLVNMSIWRDLDSLVRFVYQSDHTRIMRRRREWFERMVEAFLVLWWVPEGHRPSLNEAVAKLTLLREQGPTREAFTIRKAFLAPDAPAASSPVAFLDRCPAT
jgi:Domain of unknown function (DUF3291)